MEKLIDDIKNGRINLVVAMKVDRLTREGYDGQWFLKFCKDNNCGLIFLQENYDITTPDGEMMYGMSLLFGQKERREIGNRTRKAMEEAIKQGKYPAKTPFGYIKNKDKKLEINPMESEIVRDVFEIYAKGNNASQTAKIMRENNRFLRNNQKWTESRVTRMINNPIYKGDLLWGLYKRKKENQLFISNHSPAIVSKELWDKCQRELDRNCHGNYGENIHIFHRVVRCPECHELMNSFYTIKYANKKKKYNYYVRCLNKRCFKKGITYNAQKIEDAFINILNDLSGLAILSQYSLNFPIIDNKTNIDKIKGALTKIKNDENKLLDYYLTSDIKSDALTERLNSLSAERKSLEQKQIKLENDVVLNYNKDIATLYNDKNIGDIERINPIWSILSREAKKDIVTQFIKYIDVSIDDNYVVKIENITFNNEFLQNSFYDLPTYLLEKFKNNNKDIKYLGMLTREQLTSPPFDVIRKYSFNSMVKNYSKDRKNLETFLSKFPNQDINIAMLIENQKFTDAIIMFD